MHIYTAQRKKAKIKMAIQGPSGSGKTYSSLLIAYGLCNDWSKIVVIDSENHSAQLYSHLGEFMIVDITAPCTPEKYEEAISICEKAGMEVIIIDSITHCWMYLIDFLSTLNGNSFTNWSKITPRHNSFINKILQSPCHIISTIRTKQDYVLTEKNGKMVPEKVGLKSVQREGLDYEFTLVFDTNIKNLASASKDRTEIFLNKPEQRLSIETGIQILDWCNKGKPISVDDVTQRINDCASIQELLSLYNLFPQYKEVLKLEFEQRKRTILMANPSLTNQNNVTNGTAKH